MDQALARYLEHYAEVCLDETRPYPGIAEMLAALAPALSAGAAEQQGRSALPQDPRRPGPLPLLPRDPRRRQPATRKPDPAACASSPSASAFPVERLLLVGDTWIDAETAHNAGCAFVLVEWGFPQSPEARRREGGPRVARAGELAAALGVGVPGSAGVPPAF